MALPFEVSKKKDQPVVSLCEQGDMGLFGDPLSEKDQQKLKEQEKLSASSEKTDSRK